MDSRLVIAVSALALCFNAACSDRKAVPEASASPLPSASAQAAPAPTGSASASAAEEDAETKSRRVMEPTLYVDGQAIAGIRFLELPAKLSPLWTELAEERVDRRYSFIEYFQALGIDPKTIKQVHFLGGRTRFCILEGDELRRVGNSLTFSFTRGIQGKPAIHYPEGIKVNMQIDLIQAVMVYQQRPPPKYNAQEHYPYFEEGEPIEGIPYATDERAGGTRVYVDGSLIGAIKRKMLPKKLEIEGTTDKGLTHFGLRAYLDNIGIAPSAVRGMELIHEDEIAATFDGKAYQEKASKFEFTLPKHSRGRIQVMDLPEDAGKLDAIMIYLKSGLPNRAIPETTPGKADEFGNVKKSAVKIRAKVSTELFDDAK